MAYVYKHSRLDNNEVFYIGIGKDTGGKYLRSFDTKGRNMYWKRIVNFYNGFIVAIVFDDISWQRACQLERLMISSYGRRDLKKGKLCNLTDGGDGAINLPESVRDKIKDATRKKISQYYTNGEFIKHHRSIADASRELNICDNSIRTCAQFKAKTAGGFVFRFYQGNDSSIDMSGYKFNERIRSVNRYDLSGIFLQTYKSISEASRKTGIGSYSIHLCISFKNKTAHGFIFRYNNGSTDNIIVGSLEQRKTFKPVDRYSLDGIYIDSFPSLVNAEHITSIKRSYISACLIGIQRSAGGYIWRYSINHIKAA